MNNPSSLPHSEEIKDLLNKYHLRPDKSLGQHYLIDESVLNKTIEAAELTEGELVVEIGAGPGILTKALARAGADVLAVEFDRNFCRLLGEEFHNWRNVHVLGDDALRLDFKSLQREGVTYKKMVANIPYQITNPLVRKILEPGSVIEVAVLLIQREVAERLMAKPGSSDRGILTIMVELYGSIEKVVDVPAQSFWPAPKVESMVIKICRNSSGSQVVDNEPAFFWFVKQCFSGKRKVLTNSMAGGLHLAKNDALAIVEAAAIDPLSRAEDLSLAQWLKLYEIFKIKSN